MGYSSHGWRGPKVTRARQAVNLAETGEEQLFLVFCQARRLTNDQERCVQATAENRRRLDRVEVRGNASPLFVNFLQ
ncbi:MAG: hypothetical protein R6U51_08210 [Anaerolineales bacterium]